MFGSAVWFLGPANLMVHSNSPPTLSGCHGNEIWDKVGYNSTYVRDICEIFASIGGLSGLGHQVRPMKCYGNQI